jgi:hypothetical protein
MTTGAKEWWEKFCADSGLPEDHVRLVLSAALAAWDMAVAEAVRVIGTTLVFVPYADDEDKTDFAARLIREYADKVVESVEKLKGSSPY